MIFLFRLEAGLCLYGNDIDTTVTPIEASLAWLVAKVRRERKDFPGWEVILKQLSEGTLRKRVGFKSEKGKKKTKNAKAIIFFIWKKQKIK